MLPCNRWSCPACGRAKHRDLLAIVLADAETDPPTAVSLLTLPDPLQSIHWPSIGRSLEQLYRAIKRLAPRFAAFRVAHFDRARVHFHLLFKGVASAELPAVRAKTQQVWHHRTGAVVTNVEPIRSVEGAARYVLRLDALAVPAPRGHRRIAATANYFARPLSTVRADRRVAWLGEKIQLAGV